MRGIREGMDLEIKIATIKDVEKIQKLVEALCIKEHKEFDSTIKPRWAWGKEGKKFVLERIKNKNGEIFIAVKDDEVIGYLIGGMTQIEDYREKIRMAEIESMFVEKRFRSMKIGEELTKTFLKWCVEKKVRRIKVIASIGNERGIKFYQDQGFEDYSLTLERNVP